MNSRSRRIKRFKDFNLYPAHNAFPIVPVEKTDFSDYIYNWKGMNFMIRTIFAIKGKDKSAKVLLVDPVDSNSLTWWKKPAYFVTTSKGEFFNCPDEQVCTEKAREIMQGK